MSEKRTRLVRELIKTIALTLLVFLLIRLAAQSFRTDGESMEPGLHTDEFVLLDKVTYLFHAPERGDMLVFHFPLDTHRDFIKRVIGVPGDVVSTSSSNVMVNGMMLHEPYIRVPLTLQALHGNSVQISSL